MQEIQPQSLTNAELARYAWLMGADKLPKEWIEELIKRVEQALSR